MKRTPIPKRSPIKRTPVAKKAVQIVMDLWPKRVKLLDGITMETFDNAKEWRKSVRRRGL